ncbi:MAG: RNA 2',3'-cyclic phosphodiesterase [Sedimentisphaerales bacterium]|nr:RNA 2',3'-cyclic phosphodiesterase [Sedimentisphaerales bacterium]
MRVFIATDINDEVRRAIGNLQNKLRGELAFDKGVKWVNPEIMHLTLKFLGEVKDNILNDVCKKTEQVAMKHSVFNLDIEKAGHFGGRSARVIWVGTGGGSEQLAEIANNLDEQLQTLGFAPETRQFTGHLTLCRIKNVKAGAELAKAAEKYSDFQAGTVAVDSIMVYQSQLNSDGPIYTPLAGYNLRR